MAANTGRFPTNLATATSPGAMPASDRAAAAYTTSLAPNGGTPPSVGSVVRTNGVAGQYVPAQGDSAAHAAGLLGVYVGGTDNVVPLVGIRTCLFNGTPTVGALVYLDSGVAGALTTVAPSSVLLDSLGVCLSTDGVVYFGAQSTSPLSLQSSLDARFAALTGVEPGKFITAFDEFSLNTLSRWQTSGTVAIGNKGVSIASNAVLYSNAFFDAAATLTNVKWMFSTRIMSLAGATSYADFKLIYDGTNTLNLQIGNASSGVAGARWAQDPGTTITTITGSALTLPATLLAYCDGAGHVYASINGGAFVGPLSLTVTTSTDSQFVVSPHGGTMELDYVYFARVARSR